MASEAEIEKAKKAFYLNHAVGHDLTLDDVEDMTFSETTEAVRRQIVEGRSEQLETMLKAESRRFEKLQEQFEAEGSVDHRESISNTLESRVDALDVADELLLELRHHIDEYPADVTVTFEINEHEDEHAEVPTDLLDVIQQTPTNPAMDDLFCEDPEDSENDGEPRYRCGECGTECNHAPGLGPYCPDEDCEVGDGPGLIEIEEDDSTHLKGVEDGAGCVETWEHLSETRDDDVEVSDRARREARISGADAERVQAAIDVFKYERVEDGEDENSD